MFHNCIWDPIAESIHGLASYFIVKLFIFSSSLPALFALDLFLTPSDWWKGLVYLVLLDWIAGSARAARRGEFDSRLFTRKWYMCTGYFVVCSAAAILSNTFAVFYYLQFVVYASFFFKEFISIARKFRVLILIEVTWEMIVNKRLNFSKFTEFKDELDRRANQKEHHFSHSEEKTS